MQTGLHLSCLRMTLKRFNHGAAQVIGSIDIHTDVGLIIMSHVMRKSVYAICEQQRHYPPCRLICAFVVHCPDRIIPILAKHKMLRLWLVSVAAQPDLCLPWYKIPKTGILMTRLYLEIRDCIQL